MNNVQIAIQAIRNMNKDEVDQVVEAVKLQRTFLARSATRGLSIGDKVQFVGKRGRAVQGVVEKVNTKTAIVRDSATGGQWRVTASLLELA
jgi:hypothetical protein